MKQFFKFMFASMLGFILSVVILVLVIAGIIGAMISKGEEKEVKVNANTILKIELKSVLPERSSDNPYVYFEFGGDFNASKQLGLLDIIRNVRKAREDANIIGIYLDFGPEFYSNHAPLLELRTELDSFKASGKFVYAYADYYTDNNYFLASVADKVFINKSGELLLNGLSSNVMFFKRALDKIGVEIQVFRCGKFKGAVEPYILDKLSDENREQIASYINGLNDIYTNYTSASRKITQDEYNNILSELKIQSADDALALKIIDKKVSLMEMENLLREKTGQKATDELKVVGIGRYNEVKGKNRPKETSDKIAILYINGEIVDGEGDGEVSGAEDIIKAIRKIKKDNKIKAVILRVNSPGGSAPASDKIYVELKELAKQKPLIASFSAVAASGGYYVAMAADTIISMPNTITGSIGVFGIFPNLEKLLNDKIGITHDVVKTGKYADLGRVDRPLTDDEQAIIQRTVDRTYADFLQVVADGRDTDTGYIKTIAEGRVWTGRQAMERKLVDAEGGIMSALRIASKKMGTNEYRIVEYPEQENPFQELLQAFSKESTEEKMKSYLGEHYQTVKQLQRMQQLQGMQMLWLFQGDVR